MDDPNQIGETAKALGITQLVPVIYKDAVQPAAKVVGQKLELVAQAVGIALAPLEGLVWSYEKTKDILSAKVTAKLSNKQPEDIAQPSPVVAGPIVMNMLFAAGEPHLREMYANLLSRAMHKPDSNKAHPSFVQVIQQLSPPEAKMLEAIAGRFTARKVLFREVNSQIAPKGKRRKSMCDQWREFCRKTDENCEQTLADAFYYNFIRLGFLIERTETTEIDGAMTYRGGSSDLSPRTETSLVLTEYGDLFLDVCVREMK
jgi:hypothetical protein